MIPAIKLKLKCMIEYHSLDQVNLPQIEALSDEQISFGGKCTKEQFQGVKGLTLFICVLGQWKRYSNIKLTMCEEISEDTTTYAQMHMPQKIRESMRHNFLLARCGQLN